MQQKDIGIDGKGLAQERISLILHNIHYAKLALLAWFLLIALAALAAAQNSPPKQLGQQLLGISVSQTRSDKVSQFAS
ncbi:hypothetical protein [Rhodanobacter sp. MP7CTX1]|uniref:hypothetical protein n=1 Tax=Rhodanobacter sp. MP7CTX1 TaxID=2723084 RepID=UPI00161E8CDF|nr:hypothetical protein [Rhodanobacter sp. MP7CTX1]MBB6188558.1 hypothetical protein [Rhodanobacter sp. MP7CTX1]